MVKLFYRSRSIPTTRLHRWDCLKINWNSCPLIWISLLLFFHKVFREDTEKNSLNSLSSLWNMLYLLIKNSMLFMSKHYFQTPRQLYNTLSKNRNERTKPRPKICNPNRLIKIIINQRYKQYLLPLSAVDSRV